MTYEKMPRRERAAPSSSAGSLEILNRASSGIPIEIERMPDPTLRLRLPMPDGVRLDTWIWLPEERADRVPAILIRTPYQEHVMGWARLDTLRYRDAGYAVVFQMVRGTGRSEGNFSFNGPHDRTDGFTTIEWIAVQPWCDGAVGMDGSSYAAMTQLTAACAAPPHLKCIVPTVPVCHPFREIPYFGGMFCRMHTINWPNLISIESLSELRGGFLGVMPLLTQRDWLARSLQRPALDAADGVLRGDKLQHYHDVLAHPTLDAWWRERMLCADDYARINIPVLIISGSFDLSVGPLMLWSNLKARLPATQSCYLLIGPWDHGQSYVGGSTRFGPYDLTDESVLDMPAIRLQFFDRFLKGKSTGPDLAEPVRLFVTGANRWITADSFPLPGTRMLTLYLA